MTTVTGTTNDLEGPVVLVIEDDPSLNSTMCYALRREGYRPVSTADGEAGYTAFREGQKQISVVILDLMLPRMSGLHVLRNIRQISSVPVLIVSARGQEQDKIDGLDLGADDYLVKPFAFRELLARVRAMYRRAESSARTSSFLERGPIRIDSIGKRAWVDDRELALRPKEFGVLMTLAEGAGKVFSRQELLDLVWGEEIVVDERTVDVHVSWLRGKLRRAGVPNDPIQTAYGVGYRFTTSIAPRTGQHPEFHRQGGGDVQLNQEIRLSIG